MRKTRVCRVSPPLIWEPFIFYFDEYLNSIPIGKHIERLYKS
jgi:hypothetical protein